VGGYYLVRQAGAATKKQFEMKGNDGGGGGETTRRNGFIRRCRRHKE